MHKSWVLSYLGDRILYGGASYLWALVGASHHPSGGYNFVKAHRLFEYLCTPDSYNTYEQCSTHCTKFQEQPPNSRCPTDNIKHIMYWLMYLEWPVKLLSSDDFCLVYVKKCTFSKERACNNFAQTIMSPGCSYVWHLCTPAYDM
jgi:hypothetical protein